MKELIFNLVNGVHSGIPICCTMFFSRKAFSDPSSPVGHVVYAQRTDWEAGYVQCDHCYAKNRIVEIRKNGIILRWLVGID